MEYREYIHHFQMGFLSSQVKHKNIIPQFVPWQVSEF